jgi:arylsulfatase A-like enzyme
MARGKAKPPKPLRPAQGKPVRPAQGKPVRQAQGKPNIVLIVADDLGWNNVGYHGSAARTPNLDRLVREGVELDRFYAAPLCSPTRAGLMTGRHPLRMGVGCTVITPWRKHGLPAEEKTIAEVLARAGYKRRGCVGKWHLGHSHVRHHPLSRGFTHFYGCYNGALDYFTHIREGELDWHRGHRPAREAGYATHLISKEAVAFVAECPADEPFFLYVPYNAPHSPLQAPEKYLAMYPKLQAKQRAYAAMVTAMDEGIGQILSALKDKGVVDDTFVLFFSDNGAGIGGDNQPLRGGKATVWEGGVRVPAVVRWPSGGLRGGKKVTCPMGFIDVLPTVMRLAGAGDHQGLPLDGQDMLDRMAGKAPPPDRPWYSYVGYGTKDQLAVMEGPWKLLYMGPRILETKDPAADGQVHLFRIWDDPNEKTDLAAKNPKVVQRLLGKLKTYRSWHGKTCLLKETGTRKDFTAPKDWVLPEK